MENKEEIKESVIKALYDLFPKHIEGEIGVGKFRTQFHRIYKGGDGWMMGNEKIYVIVEVMEKLVKLSSYDLKQWFFHSESGGAMTLDGDMVMEKIYGHCIHNYNVSQKNRKNGTLYRSLD